LQDHSKSLILIPIESPYATLLTYTLSRTVSSYRAVFFTLFHLTNRASLVNALVLDNLLKYRYKSYTAKN